MKTQAPSFKEWSESRANPLFGANDTVRFFAWPALRAAFKAGEEHKRTENADLQENIFDAP